MKLEPLQPQSWPRPRGYSNGFRVPAGHDLIFTGGMVGWDASEQIVPGGFVPQFRQALENILAVVECGGGSATDIVSMTVFVVDRDDYLGSLKELGHAWRETLGRVYPAMALVQIAGLVETGARLEIQAVAAVAPRTAG